MRKILAAGAVLASMLCSSAQAGLLYRWEADCLARATFDIDTMEKPRNLGCQGDKKVRGLIEVDDSYVPGTEYYSWWGEDEPPLPSYPILTLFDTYWRLRIDHVVLKPNEDDGIVVFQLPELSGPGVVGWTSNPFTFGPSGWFLESPYPVGSWIDWENMVFTRKFQVPEPSSLALLGAGLLGVLGVRRRVSNHKSA